MENLNFFLTFKKLKTVDFFLHSETIVYNLISSISADFQIHVFPQKEAVIILYNNFFLTMWSIAQLQDEILNIKSTAHRKLNSTCKFHS